MSKRVGVWSVSLFVVMVIGAGVTFLLWPEGSAAEDQERDFCWNVSERVSPGSQRKGGSVSACAASLEKAAKKDRAALRTEIVTYGRHVVKEDPDGMPVPVRRALSRALAERRSLVHESLAPIGPRESGVVRTYLDRKMLSATVRALVGDDTALRTLRTSQESYARSRIGTLTRADFDKGMDSRRAVSVAESVGGATGTLTSLALRAQEDAPRGDRVDYEERHGYTRIRNQLEAHARAVGVPQSEIEDVTSSLSDFKLTASNAYDRAARGVRLEAKQAARGSGITMGVLHEIRASVLASDRDSEIDRSNWDETYKYLAFGAPVTGIPCVGDSVQRSIDISTGQHAAALNQAEVDGTRAELIEYYSPRGYPRLREVIEARAGEAGNPQADIPNSGSTHGDVKNEARGACQGGIGGSERNEGRAG